MTTKLRANRVRRTYLGGGRIDAFTGFAPDCSDGVPRPEDWLASTTTAFNGTREIAGEGLGRLEDGRLVNIYGNGNRVAASINGPRRVCYVVGRNKIVAGGVDDAIARIKRCACPPNCRRLGKKTPCAATGVCADCDSPDRICKVTVVFDRKPTGVACEVVLVDEDLGY